MDIAHKILKARQGVWWLWYGVSAASLSACRWSDSKAAAAAIVAN
jgi:hypothetical protein